MGRAITVGNPPIPIDIRRSARARRMTLRVSRLDGQVRLSLPKRTPECEALHFLAQQEEWLRRQLAGLGAARQPAIGDSLPLRGEPLRIVAGTGRVAQLCDGAIAVPPDPERLPARLAAFLKEEARRDLAARSAHHAAALGVGYARITLRDTRSRWGSCSSTGGLMYSWRLVMAPPAVLDYVAAHEVAHLREMNHSPRFWALVADRVPDWRTQRLWLRQNGSTLHRFRFGD